MKLLQSLSFRLALTYVLLFAGSLLLILGINYWVSIARPLEAARGEVAREADLYSDIYVVDGEAALLKRLEARRNVLAPRKAFHAFIGADGKVVSANIPSWPAAARPGFTRIEADLYVDGDEEDHEALVLDMVFPTGARLIIGRDVEDIDEREEALADAALWTLSVALLLGIVGGILMSRAIGRRIEAVNTAARAVIGGDLGGRVAVRGTGDDFDRLGETLNLMLDRVENSVEAIRRVSDNVAHELRTPLARMQGLVDTLEAAHERGETAEVDALLGRISGETKQLQTIFDALLRIARIESGRHELRTSEIDLGKLVEDAGEFYQPGADDKSITLTIEPEPGLVISGDPDLIFQGVCNLLDNALKYTPEGGAVHVQARRSETATLVRIVDNGPGVDEASRKKLTERFFRAQNAEASEGFGLGLSLVSAIAALHRSSLTFSDAAPGLCVEWRFPRAVQGAA